MEQICSEGFDAQPELMRIILNMAMEMKCQKPLRAGPYQRTPQRQGHANGYKDKTVATLIYPRYENVTSIPVPWRRDYAVSGL